MSFRIVTFNPNLSHLIMTPHQTKAQPSKNEDRFISRIISVHPYLKRKKNSKITKIKKRAGVRTKGDEANFFTLESNHKELETRCDQINYTQEHQNDED